jgi:hypothetical protein
MGSHSTQTNKSENHEKIKNVGYQDNTSHTEGTWNLGQDVKIVQNGPQVGGSILNAQAFQNEGNACLGLGCTGAFP